MSSKRVPPPVVSWCCVRIRCRPSRCIAWNSDQHATVLDERLEFLQRLFRGPFHDPAPHVERTAVTGATNEVLLRVPAQRAAFVRADRGEGSNRSRVVGENEWVIAASGAIGRTGMNVAHARDLGEPLARESRDRRVAGGSERSRENENRLERRASIRRPTHFGRLATVTVMRCGNSPTLIRVTSFRSGTEITEIVLSRRLLTYANCPFRLNTTQFGSRPTGTVPRSFRSGSE